MKIYIGLNTKHLHIIRNACISDIIYTMLNQLTSKMLGCRSINVIGLQMFCVYHSYAQ